MVKKKIKILNNGKISSPSAEGLGISNGIVHFNSYLYDLVAKHLLQVPLDEIENFYGKLHIAELIKEFIELEKRFPRQNNNPSFYV